MTSPTTDGVLLLLLVLLLPLPLHLLSLRFRLRCRPSDKRFRALRSVLLLASAPILLSAIFAVPDLGTSQSNDGAIAQLEELKLKVTQLESILEENTEDLNSKTLHLERNYQLTEKMEQEIQVLQYELYNIKESSSGSTHSKERLNAMVEEVQQLWEESRRNNFNIHILESKTYDAEEKLEAIASELEKMENIVTEQWIQIRQLEQSLHMTKIMTSRVHNRRREPSKCTMLKFIKSIQHGYFPDLIGFPDSVYLGGSISKSWISRAFDEFKIIVSAAKKWHHELQGFVKQTMEMNEFTAAFANKEVVFFMATAIFTFPVMSAWVLCSSCFDQTD